MFFGEREQEVARFAVVLVTLLLLISEAVWVQTASLLRLGIEWKNLVQGVFHA